MASTAGPGGSTVGAGKRCIQCQRVLCPAGLSTQRRRQRATTDSGPSKPRSRGWSAAGGREVRVDLEGAHSSPDGGSLRLFHGLELLASIGPRLKASENVRIPRGAPRVHGHENLDRSSLALASSPRIEQVGARGGQVTQVARDDRQYLARGRHAFRLGHGLPIGLAGAGLSQPGHGVGVEQEHQSKLAGRAGSAKVGISSSAPSTPRGSPSRSIRLSSSPMSRW